MHDMWAMNDAFLMKIGWGLIAKQDNLWVRVLKSKYGNANDGIVDVNASSSGSYFWRAIGRIWNDINKWVKWSLGDG